MAYKLWSEKIEKPKPDVTNSSSAAIFLGSAGELFYPPLKGTAAKRDKERDTGGD